jgi:endonuclease/exonuclease/phosphatase family metal-dependent hydrolase
VTDQAGNQSTRTGVVNVAPATVAAGQPLKVVQWNSYKGRTTDTRVEGSKIWLFARWIAAEQPDVVLLQEVMGSGQAVSYKKQLEAAMPGTTWSYFYRSDANVNSTTAQGVAILTRLAIKSTASIAYTPCPSAQIVQRAAIAVVVNVNGTDITIVDTHLSSYLGTADEGCRYNQSLQLTEWASTLGEPRIIGGDLNASPDERTIAGLWQNYNDSWNAALQAAVATSYPDNPPTDTIYTRSERIDYVMTSKGSDALTVVAAQVPDTRDFTNPNPIYSQGMTLWPPHNLAPRVSDHDSTIVSFIVRPVPPPPPPAVTPDPPPTTSPDPATTTSPDAAPTTSPDPATTSPDLTTPSSDPAPTVSPDPTTTT